MSFFDRFRSKWKHPDPAVREAAIAGIGDQTILEKLALNDPSEGVRIAAVRALTDQKVLARIAAGSSAVALAAMQRLQDRKLIAKVAQSAASHAVRELAVERIDDGVTLHRISTSDTDARVRLKARSRRSGPDPVRDFIRLELAKLEPGGEGVETDAGFAGTLDEVTANLISDPRFRINGWLDHDIPGRASVGTLEGREPSSPILPRHDSGPARHCARFLAFKRAESGDPEEAATSHVYFEIRVWRVESTRYASSVEERSLKLVANAAEWSRVSNASTRSEGLTRETDPKNRRE
jgi:hypothetical protein